MTVYSATAWDAFQIDEKKFPFLAGLDAGERIRRLNERTRAAGWRGAALWCRNPATGGDAAKQTILWSKNGGVEYWKIDGGDDNFDLAKLVKNMDPLLKTEHVHQRSPPQRYVVGTGGDRPSR